MKKYILFLLVAVTALTGCKKEAMTAEETNSEKIQGKWDVVLTREVEYQSGKLVTEEKPVTRGTIIFEFAGNSGNFSTDGETQPFQFTIEDNELVFRIAGHSAIFYKFKFNSEHQLELSVNETATDGQVTYEESFTYILDKM